MQPPLSTSRQRDQAAPEQYHRDRCADPSQRRRCRHLRVATRDAHAVRLAAARQAARHLATDAVEVVLLNSAPLSLSGRVLASRREILDRDPHTRHAYESATLRKFHDFRIREHRILTERRARG